MTTSEQLEKLSESIKACADQCVEVHVEKKENISDLFFCTKHLYHIAEITQVIALKEKR